MSPSSRRRAAAVLVAIGVAGAAAAQRSATIWDGVYTAEQARRGQAVYTGPCDRCHGYKLDGAHFSMPLGDAPVPVELRQ